MKICSKCKVEKPVEGFHRHVGYKDGRRSCCNSCTAAYRKIKWAGTSPEDRKRLLAEHRVWRNNRSTEKRAAARQRRKMRFSPEFQALAEAAGRLARINRVKKICTKCGIKRLAAEFAISRRAPGGLHSWCGSCVRAGQKRGYSSEQRREELLREKYGLSEEDVLKKRAEQNNKCAICRMEFTASRGRSASASSIDHCHRTGAFRGLLCRMCNTGLGFFKDSEEMLSGAIQYLRKHKPNQKTERK